MSKAERLQFIRGLAIPDVPWFPRKNIEEAFDYVPHDGDIVVACYPKTGSTWLQYIVQQITSKDQSLPSIDEMLRKVVPVMELVGAEAVEALECPRIYKHHLPYNLMTKNGKSKYLYIYRNPEDVVVSYYHFTKEYLRRHLDFDEYFDDFLAGNVGFGSCFDHMMSYLSHRDDGNILLVSYEKLHANIKEEILRIAKFLGDEYESILMKDESMLEKIIEQTSFEHMKKNLDIDHQAPGSDGNSEEKFNFFRKGVVGDGKNVLSVDQRKRFREMIVVMGGTAVMNEWLKE